MYTEKLACHATINIGDSLTIIRDKKCLIGLKLKNK